MAFFIPAAASSAFFSAEIGWEVDSMGISILPKCAGKPFEQIGVSLRRGIANFSIERVRSGASAFCVFDA